jgi:hypothetical protein
VADIAPTSAPGPATTAGTSVSEPRAAKPGYLETLTPEDRALIAEVEERVNYKARDSARWALEREIFEICAFYCGVMWLEYTETTRRFMRWNAPSWFPTPVTNLMAPLIGKMVSAILRSEPQGKVRPNTNDPDDRQAAKVGQELIRHFYDVTDEESLRQYAAPIVTLMGTVIAEDNFNPRAGRIMRVPRGTLQDQPVTDPAASCPGCGAQGDETQVGQPCPGCQTPMEASQTPHLLPDGTPATQTQFVPETDPTTGQPLVDEVPEGELESRLIMLFNFYWDQKAKTLNESRWCGETQYADLDWIDENYPDLGPFVAAESGIDGANFFESSLLALVGPSIQGTAHYGGIQFFTNGAIIRRYQRKPSQKYPNGLYLVVANGVLLHKGPLVITDENDRPTGDFTYTEFRYDIMPGRFPGKTPASDMVPLQKRVNGMDSQIVLNRKTLLSPWLLAPKGSGLNPGVVAMRPGATVVYNFVGVGAAPQVVQGTPLPAQIYQEREGCQQALSGLAEDAIAQTAQTPQGMRSGIAFNLVNELQEAMKLPRRKRWALWVRDRDRKRLLLAQKFYREPRAVKLLGEGSEYQVRYWKGSDLRGNTDVTVDWGSLQPKSPSLKSQMVFDAIEAQLIDITDPVHKQQALEELGLGTFELKVGPDRRRADAENAAMDDGQQVQITDIEDSDIHLLVHGARIKEPGFDQLPPEAQHAHMAHYQATEQAIQQQQQQAEQEQVRQAAIQAALGAAAKGAQPPMVQGDIGTVPQVPALLAPPAPPNGAGPLEPSGDPGQNPAQGGAGAPPPPA